MKRICFLWMILSLSAAPAMRAQDAATEERINRLNGKIEDLIERQEGMKKQLAELSRELAQELNSVRDQVGKGSANYVSQDEFRGLAKSVKEVDNKRLDDYEKIHKEILNLRKILETPAAPVRPPKNVSTPPKEKDADLPKKEDGYEYVIQKGDTLSVIVQACKDKSVKVTTSQIVKANPGLDPNKLKVGQKIFIPATPQ